MAATYQSHANGSTTNASSLSYTHSGVCGSDRMLVVHTSVFDACGTGTVTGVTAGTGCCPPSMTEIGCSVTHDNVTKQMWKLDEPDTGNITITVTADAEQDEVNAMSVNFQDADDALTPVSNTGSCVTSISATLSCTGANSVCVDFVDVFDGGSGSGYAADCCDTERISIDNGSVTQSQFCATVDSAGGNVTMGWSWTGNLVPSIFAVEVTEAVVGGPAGPPLMLGLAGVGR